MKIERVTGLFFSATGNTRKVTEEITYALGDQFDAETEALGITKPAARKRRRRFDGSDLLVIGLPTYAGKLPNKIPPDLSNITAEGALAVCVVTFGNRAFDHSLAELVHTMTENGFTVIGGGAFACRHAFTDKLAAGRPDEEDLAAARQFAADAAAKVLAGDFTQPLIPGDAAAPYYVPLREDGERAVFLKARPKLDPELCDRCGICAEVCPMGAIDRENVKSVPGICIKCQACVRRCPKKARYFDDPDFLSHVAMLERDYTERKENAFFL